MYDPTELVIPEITSTTKLLDALYYTMLEWMHVDSDRTPALLISAAVALLGLALCFFGWPFRRVMGAVMGAIAAFFLAVVVYYAFSLDLDDMVYLVISLAAAAAAAALLFRFPRAGEFLLAFLAAGGTVFVLTISPYGNLTLSRLLPSLAVGAAYAGAAIRWRKPLVVLGTAVLGGIAAGTFGMPVVNSNTVSDFKIAIIVLAAAGFAVQWFWGRKPGQKVPAATASYGGFPSGQQTPGVGSTAGGNPPAPPTYGAAPAQQTPGAGSAAGGNPPASSGDSGPLRQNPGVNSKESWKND